MTENQIHELATIIMNKDLHNYVGEGFLDFIQAVVMKDPYARIKVAKEVKDIIFQMPTLLFWDKMQRFLFGTFRSYEDQVKMAEKFNKDSKSYAAFVKRQIHLINALDDDMKVDYFATLTRCFLLTDLDQAFYFKLSKFLSICTPEELLYLKQCPYDITSENTAIISSLFQYGLFTQLDDNETGETRYLLSDFAKALKQNSLNYEDGLGGQTRLISYGQLTPLNLPESATNADMNEMLREVFGDEMVSDS